MADADYCVKPYRLASQLPPFHETQKNPNQFSTHIVHKALILGFLLLVLPLIPSEAPEFINPTLHARSWEFLQLLFVGIAVSYGLFSRKTDETSKEQHSKFDNAHSYVSRLLQVSPIFEDEDNGPSGYCENKIQTWNSHYYREEPVVAVAPQEKSVIEEQRGQKPLRLPVRSLKSRVPDFDSTKAIYHPGGRAASLYRSNSNPGSNRFTVSGKHGGSGPQDLEDSEEEENIVLRSPIPWGSRSGRKKIKQEEMEGVPQFSLPTSMEEPEKNRLDSRSFRPQVSHTSPLRFSPKKPSSEEASRKKIYYESSPPPAPPLPPPIYARKLPPKELKRSTRSVPENPGWNDRGAVLRRAGSVADSIIKPRVEEDQAIFNEKSGKSTKLIYESMPIMPEQASIEYEEEEEDVEEELILETEEVSESEGDDVFEEGSDSEDVGSKSVNDGGPDVDKKADEFIAKFREQIRQQRIQSIKRSSEEIVRSSLR
ncbi:hypothetical protein NMG60_11027357 [Bertholletia excelsa]